MDTPTSRLQRMDERLRQFPWKVCAYLFFAALAVRVLYLSQYANSPFFWSPALDALYHDLLARGIAAGNPPEGAYFRAPAYYYFLAGIYKVFGHNFWAVRLLQAVIGSLSCVLLYRLGERVFRPTIGLLAAIAMAFYGPLVYFDGELHTPVLEVFFDLLLLLLVARAAQQGCRRDWALAGLVLGLSAITRPNILVVVPVLLAVIWLRRNAPPARLRLAASLALLIGTALLPGLVTARNYLRAGDLVFIASQGGINFHLGNRPEADGFTPSTPTRYRFNSEYEDSVALYGQRAAEEALGRPLKASESQSYWVRQVLDWWRQEPGKALSLTWKKWVLAWTRQEIRNTQAFDFIRAEFAPLLWACAVGFWLAGPLGLLGMGLAWKERPNSRFLMGFVLLYICSFVLFFTADRYRLPVVPALLLFGAYAAAWIWERAGAGEFRRLAPAGAALLALVLWTNVDWYRTATPATWAADHWCAGNRYRDMGRLPEAEQQYARALKLDSQNPEIWTNLGAVQYGTDRYGEAVKSFQTAIRLAPQNASNYYNLAQCAMRLGRPADARVLLQTAIQVEPDYEPARTALAQMQPKGG